jgi:hypothetical protein
MIDRASVFAYTPFSNAKSEWLLEARMLSTYRALLRGQVLEWLNDRPKDLSPDQTVVVHVTILEETIYPQTPEQGRKMAAILEKIAHSASSVATLDPMQWEREMRQERVLPGRDVDAD